MEQMYITRLEHVCSRLTKMGLTQMIVSDPLSIRYLTGVWVDPYERLYALYLRTDGKMCIRDSDQTDYQSQKNNHGFSAAFQNLQICLKAYRGKEKHHEYFF